MTSSHERMKRAMLIMESAGSIQMRLASAYRTEVQYVGPEGLDEGAVYELETINDELTKLEAAGDKDAIDMSAESLTDDEAQALADQMRYICEYLAATEGKGA
jgi:NADH/NAD ratio-sensing transcriptional regulator Rex